MSKILIVDDNASNRRFLVTLLANEGHRLIEASDGVEALAKVRAERPDLVITDILMPAMDGCEFVRRLRADPEFCEKPAVAYYTASYHEREARALAQACGVQHVIAKPSRPEDVLRVVHELLGSGPAAAPSPGPYQDLDRGHLELLANKLTEKVKEAEALNAQQNEQIQQQVAALARLRAERDRSLAQVRLQIDRLPLAYVHVNADIIVVDWNAAAEKVFGYAKDELLGRSPLGLIVELPLPERVQEVMRRLQAGDMDAHIVHENRTKEGRIIVCEWFNTPLMDADGKFAGMISLAQDITERKQAETKLADYAARLQTLSGRLMEIQEAERRHLARELHDGIGQHLTVLCFDLQMLKGAAEPEEQARLQSCITEMERAMQQVRELALELRPAMLDALGLEAALHWLVEVQSQRTGFPVQLRTNLSGARLDPKLETVCYRLVQEALANVIRHARAQQVEVSVERTERELVLSVRDDGVGFDMAAARSRAARGESLGLLGMQERVKMMYGSLNITSAPSRGTQIWVRIPLTQVPQG